MKSKKLPVIVFTAVIFGAAVFFAAKLVPCQAYSLSCRAQKPTSFNQSVQLRDYSAADLESSLKQLKRPILFFQASWCSTCYLIEQNFLSHSTQIPTDVVIYKVNLDEEKELKQKYRVVAQDEMVQVNAKLQEVSHWKSSENAVDELLLNLK